MSKLLLKNDTSFVQVMRIEVGQGLRKLSSFASLGFIPNDTTASVNKCKSSKSDEHVHGGHREDLRGIGQGHEEGHHTHTIGRVVEESLLLTYLSSSFQLLPSVKHLNDVVE